MDTTSAHELIDLPRFDLRHANDLEEACRSEVIRKMDAVFRQSGHESLRRVMPWYTAGMVELTGSVPSFYMKQLAQELARQAFPEYSVRNSCRVRPVLWLKPE